MKSVACVFVGLATFASARRPAEQATERKHSTKTLENLLLALSPGAVRKSQLAQVQSRTGRSGMPKAMRDFEMGEDWKGAAGGNGFYSRRGFKDYLKQLPIYRPGLSPVLRGLEIGMAHGYWVPGPFTILGPLRNTEVGTAAGFIAGAALMTGVVGAAKLYGAASFQTDNGDPNSIQSAKGWRDFTTGVWIGSLGGAYVGYSIFVDFIK